MSGAPLWSRALNPDGTKRRGSPGPSDPEERRPEGLPLRPINLGIQVSLADFAGETPIWPPIRCIERAARMELQERGSVGDFTPWLDTELFDVQVSPIQAYEEDVSALLMAQPPGLDLDDELQAQVSNSIEGMNRDMLRHGRSIVLGNASTVFTLPIRFSWPLAEGGWVMVMPETSAEAQDINPDQVRVLVWLDGVMTGMLREWDGSSQLGSVIGELPAVAVDLAVADRAPIMGGWGTPISDRLINLAVAMSRRESGVDWAIDRNERPLTQFRMDVQPQTIAKALPDMLQHAEIDTKALRGAAPSLRAQDVLIVPPGMDPGEMLTWDQNIDGSDRFLMRLDTRWSEQTGFSPIESGDSADVPSGVAIARRSFRGTARTAQLHHSIRRAISQVMGTPLLWDYIGNSMGMAPTEDDDMDEDEF